MQENSKFFELVHNKDSKILNLIKSLPNIN